MRGPGHSAEGGALIRELDPAWANHDDWGVGRSTASLRPYRLLPTKSRGRGSEELIFGIPAMIN